MRLSSFVSLLVVTASLALGGCAADADQTETTGTGAAALVGSPRANTDTSVEKASVQSKEGRLIVEAPRAINADSDHRANPGLQGATVKGLTAGAYRAQHTSPGLQGAGIEGDRTAIDPLGNVAANDVALANTDPVIAAGLPAAGDDTLDTSGSGTAHARRDP
jgi:hypothetical protein